MGGDVRPDLAPAPPPGQHCVEGGAGAVSCGAKEHRGRCGGGRCGCTTGIGSSAHPPRAPSGRRVARIAAGGEGGLCFAEEDMSTLPALMSGGAHAGVARDRKSAAWYVDAALRSPPARLRRTPARPLFAVWGRSTCEERLLRRTHRCCDEDDKTSTSHTVMDSHVGPTRVIKKTTRSGSLPSSSDASYTHHASHVLRDGTASRHQGP